MSDPRSDAGSEKEPRAENLTSSRAPADASEPRAFAQAGAGESSEPIEARAIVPEWLTSFLDGEASGDERAQAKKALATSGELKKEAEELQKAWDLLDFLPKSDPEPDKSRATMELVLSRSSIEGLPLGEDESLPEDGDGGEREIAADTRVDGLHGAGLQAESGSQLDRRTEHPHLSSTVRPGARRARLFIWFKQMLPLAGMGASGIVLGLLALGAWNGVENRRREKLQKIQGVVENLQLLRESGNLDFLEAIEKSDLFGLTDTGPSHE